MNAETTPPKHTRSRWRSVAFWLPVGLLGVLLSVALASSSEGMTGIVMPALIVGALADSTTTGTTGAGAGSGRTSTLRIASGGKRPNSRKFETRCPLTRNTGRPPRPRPEPVCGASCATRSAIEVAP